MQELKAIRNGGTKVIEAFKYAGVYLRWHKRNSGFGRVPVTHLKVHFGAWSGTILKFRPMKTSTHYVIQVKVKGKAVPLHAWSGPEGSRKLRFPHFMTTAQDGGGCQPYAPAAFTPRKCSWYSFLLQAESIPGP